MAPERTPSSAAQRPYPNFRIAPNARHSVDELRRAKEDIPVNSRFDKIRRRRAREGERVVKSSKRGPARGTPAKALSVLDVPAAAIGTAGIAVSSNVASSTTNLFRASSSQVSQHTTIQLFEDGKQPKLAAHVSIGKTQARGGYVGDRNDGPTINAGCLMTEEVGLSSAEGSQESLTLEQYIKKAYGIQRLTLPHSPRQSAVSFTKEIATAVIHNATGTVAERGVHTVKIFPDDEKLDDIELALLGEPQTPRSSRDGALQRQSFKHARSPEEYGYIDAQNPQAKAGAVAEDGSFKTSANKCRQPYKTMSQMKRHSEISRGPRTRRTLKPSQSASEYQRVDEKITSKKVSSRKKRKSRRLPVNELVTASERYEWSGSEENDELSQDPISQESDISKGSQSPKLSNSKKRNALLIARNNFRGPNGFGPIDLETFRIPKAKLYSPRSRSRLRRNPIYSDGFEGAEAYPIGRLMPVKGLIRRSNIMHKTTVRFGELAIVQERKETKPGAAQKSREENPMDESTGEKEHISANRSPEDITGKYDKYKPLLHQHTSGHSPAAIRKAICTPRTMERQTSMDTLPSNPSPREPLVNSDSPLQKRHLKRTVSFKEEIDVCAQLMMVTIKREPVSNDDDDDEEDESDDESNNQYIESGSQKSSDDDSSNERIESSSDRSSEMSDTTSEPDNETEEVVSDGDEDTSSQIWSAILPASPLLLESNLTELKTATQDLTSLYTEAAASQIPQYQPPLSADIEAITLRNTKLNKDMAHFKNISGGGSSPQDMDILFPAQRVYTQKNNVNEFSAKLSQASRTFRQRAVLSAEDIPKPCWRPRMPPSSTMVMEVEEDILDITPTKSSINHSRIKKRATSNPNQSLTFGGSKAPKLPPQDAFPAHQDSRNLTLNSEEQLSPEILESQLSYHSTKPSRTQLALKFPQHSYDSSQSSQIRSNTQPPSPEIPDSQISCHRIQSSRLDGSMQSQLPDIPESQLSYQDTQSSQMWHDKDNTNILSENTYFLRASQQLSVPSPTISNLTRKMAVSRRKVGEVATSEALQHAVSSSPSTSLYRPDTPFLSQDLGSLARRASFEMGTTLSSNRRRIRSLPFVPPFKKA